MRLSPSLLGLTYVLAMTASSVSHAQIMQPRKMGMNHTIVSPSNDEDAQKSREEEAKKAVLEALEAPLKNKVKDNKAQPTTPIAIKHLDKPAEDLPYFVPMDDVFEWPYIADLLSSDLTRKASSVAKLNDMPERASPMMLVLAAEYYLNMGNKEQAALYLYAAQLRAQFDIKRWPVPEIDEDNPASFRDHPAYETINLSKDFAKGLTGWFISNKARAELLLQKIEAWDKATPYAYYPTYEVPSSVDMDEWEDLHAQNVETFFADQRKILDVIHGQ